MKKICTYGLPETERTTLTNIVELARKMDANSRAQLENAAKAIKLVHDLNAMKLPDGQCTA